MTLITCKSGYSIVPIVREQTVLSRVWRGDKPVCMESVSCVNKGLGRNGAPFTFFLFVYLIFHKLSHIHTIVYLACTHKINFLLWIESVDSVHIKLIKQCEFDISFICCLILKICIPNTCLLCCRSMFFMFFLYWLLTDCKHRQKIKWSIFYFRRVTVFR